MMHHDPQPVQPIDLQLRALQIIIGALIAGVIVFGAIVASGSVQPAAPLDPMVQNILMLTAFGIMLTAMAVRTVVRRAIIRSAGDEVDEQQLFVRFSAWIITTAAMFEGAALLGVVLALLSGDLGHLIIAAAALLLLFGAAFPTRARWEALLADALYRRA